MRFSHSTLFAGGLVFAQFVLAAVLVLSTNWAMLTPLPSLLMASALCCVGSGLAVWAWFTMGLLRLRVMPHPSHAAHVVSNGPYRYVRHPMYSGLLIATLGCCLWDPQVWRIATWVALCLVLALKSRLEERLLVCTFHDYPAYQQRTSRFLPWIY